MTKSEKIQAGIWIFIMTLYTLRAFTMHMLQIHNIHFWLSIATAAAAVLNIRMINNAVEKRDFEFEEWRKTWDGLKRP